MNTCKDDLTADHRTGPPVPVEANLTLIAERGNWSIETFEQDHREHYRLRRGGIKVLDVAPDDISDLFDLFTPGVLEHGFEGYAAGRFTRPRPDTSATGTTVIDPDEEAFIRSLG